MTSDPLVRCRDLSIARGGRRVVDGVSLTLGAGETIVVGGATGSGKSSLVRVVASADSALRIDGGEGEVVGISLRARGRRERVRAFSTGFVAQDAAAQLAARLTVSEVIAEPVTSRDRSANHRALAHRVAVLLDELELPLGVAAKYPYELSTGMRQRVAVARAFMVEPPLFVGDEIFAGLDLDARRAVRDALVRRGNDGMGVLLVAGDLDVARDLHASVLILRQGHVIGLGVDADSLVWTPGKAPADA